MTYSCGPNAIIMCGIPAGKQRAVGKLPIPPLAWSAMLASSTAWYSAVSGASWPNPQGLVWSCPAWPGRPRVMKRAHCPFQFGYFPSSAAGAVLVVAPSAAAKTSKTIEVRAGMAGFSVITALADAKRQRNVAQAGSPGLGAGMRRGAEVGNG